MTTIKIPSTPNPYIVELNGRRYVYPAGSIQSVPSDVAAMIQAARTLTPPKAAEPWTPDEVEGGHVTPAQLTAILADYQLKSGMSEYAKAADVMPKAASIEGYDAAKEQTLTNDTGTVKWADVPAAE